MPNIEGFMRMALRAQSQCRTTLETLAAIKNPPSVYARQANRERMWRAPYLYLPYASDLYAFLLNSDYHKGWIYSHMKGRSTDGRPQ